MNTKVEQRVVTLQRREYLCVDRPTIDNVTATNSELNLIRSQYDLTLMEAQIIWLLRNFIPVDLSLIPSARTHIHSMRRKLKKYSNIEIKNLWRGVYQLLIVGD